MHLGERICGGRICGKLGEKMNPRRIPTTKVSWLIEKIGEKMNPRRIPTTKVSWLIEKIVREAEKFKSDEVHKQRTEAKKFNSKDEAYKQSYKQRTEAKKFKSEDEAYKQRADAKKKF